MLAIGDYKEDDDLRDLKAKTDYCQMIHTFHDVWGYSVFFQCNEKNSGSTKDKLLDPILNGLNRQQFKKQCKCQKKFDFKDTWTWEEIDTLCENGKELLRNAPTDGCYDSLIFIVSCHGEEECIIDSKGEVYQLLSLFSHFQNKNIPYLTDKPKIFFLDLCRGSSVHPAAPNSISGNSSKTNESIASHFVSVPRHVSTSHLTNDAGARRVSHIEYSEVDYVRLMQEVHREANFAKIYSNPAGYAAVEGTSGGVLIRSIKYVFSNVNEVKKGTLDDVYRQISNKSHKRTKRLALTQPNYDHTMTFKISFDKYGQMSKNQKISTLNNGNDNNNKNHSNKNSNGKNARNSIFGKNKVGKNSDLDITKTARVSVSALSPSARSQSHSQAPFNLSVVDELQ